MPISLEEARKAFEEFNPHEFAAEILLELPLDYIDNPKEVDEVIQIFIHERQIFLEAQYKSALKKEMADAEDRDCWQKV